MRRTPAQRAELRLERRQKRLLRHAKWREHVSVAVAAGQEAIREGLAISWSDPRVKRAIKQALDDAIEPSQAWLETLSDIGIEVVVEVIWALGRRGLGK